MALITRKDAITASISRMLKEADKQDFRWPDDSEIQYGPTEQSTSTRCTETCPIDYEQIEKDLAAQGLQD